MINHNVETSRVKTKGKFCFYILYYSTDQKPMRYFGHICGDTRHKFIYCFKYNDMHNMFKYKGMNITNKQVMVEPNVSNPLVHMVDVNMAIARSKVTKEHVIKDREPIKKKYVPN
jgi:hypothetical protein